jgi:SpoVK/Ycf46/Vps4 family AAA+-type ATPase
MKIFQGESSLLMVPALFLVITTQECLAFQHQLSPSICTLSKQRFAIENRKTPWRHASSPTTFLYSKPSASSPVTTSDSSEPMIAKIKSRSQEPEPEGPGPILDSIPSEFQTLFSLAAQATTPREQPTGDTATNAMKDGHDPFRYEWGTWVKQDVFSDLMAYMDQVKVKDASVYNSMLERYGGRSKTIDDDDNKSSDEDEDRAVRVCVAGGDAWDCMLHVLPPGSAWQGRWPTGSWAIVKSLLGMAEVAMLRGPDRNTGEYKKATTKKLRGGSDGSLGSGASTTGDDCVKYVGGPLRSYAGQSGNTVVLEIVIRPPINTDVDMTGIGDKEFIEPLTEDIATVLDIREPPEPEPVEEDNNTPTTITTTAKEITKPSSSNKPPDINSALGMSFDEVGGLDVQLNSIARRVLASRANPAAAKRLGVSHVRGILLSGPPGCGKTLLARELSKLLGAREPQIVNGPEILDKFIGEAEKKVRDLFAPAEQEYAQVGDDSALHVIIFDEMDAIARKRGSASSDTTGVRDSVVNQLLAKMDGVKEASNVLVVGLTNRPELLDPALLRPGRLEVQLRIELPDREGRRDILRIHTRQMRDAGGISAEAIPWIENVESDLGLPALLEHYSGAEIAGLVRSAASFALARVVQTAAQTAPTTSTSEEEEEEGVVTVADLQQALQEVRPALGKQDEVLKQRFPFGISQCNSSMKRITRDLGRFVSPSSGIADGGVMPPRLESLLIVGAGGNGGAGATALAAWAAAEASANGASDYVRFVTALDILSGGGGGTKGGGGDEARAGALVEKFNEAREMTNSLLVLDDIDQLCAGDGRDGYSNVMLATLRALLRTPPPTSAAAKAGGHSDAVQPSKAGGKKRRRSMHILATTSRSDAACNTLHELFDETIGEQHNTSLIIVHVTLSTFSSSHHE